MPYYRVYLLDEQGRIESGYDLCCEDDRAACEQAQAAPQSRAWELWSGTKKIGCGQAHLPAGPRKTEESPKPGAR